MPIFIRYSGYKVFFWSHENGEPLHFHVSDSEPSPHSTKVWILSDGSFLVANNKSRIPHIVLRRIYRIMEDNMDDYMNKWMLVHGKPTFYM